MKHLFLSPDAERAHQPAPKPRINYRELLEVAAIAEAADFPGRTEHHLEAQLAVKVMQEPRLKEEVPYYMRERRARAARFAEGSSAVSFQRA